MSKVVAISTGSFAVESSQPLELLRAAGFEPRINPHRRTLTSEEARAHLDGAIGVVAGTEKLTGDLLRQLPMLKCISRVGVGIDAIDLAAAKELGIQVRNTPAAHVDAVAELTLGGMLAALRSIPASDASIRAGKFEKPMGGLLRGKCVGLIGFGRVARALATLLQPFGCTLLACDIAPDESAARALDVDLAPLQEILRRADVVSLHVPYTKENHEILGSAQIALLKADAVVVNTARGGLVDEQALLAFLEANPRARAYVDCFAIEPYKGPLAKLPNVVLTSHIGSYAREARVQMETEAVQNLLRVLSEV